MSKVDDMFFENASRVTDRIEDINKELLSKVKLNVPYIQELITDFSDFSVTVIDRAINNQDGLKEFYTPLMASSMPTALINTFRYPIPIFTFSTLAHASNPFSKCFQNKKKKIQVNDLISQIPRVANWTWHLFVCPNGSLNN